MGICLYNHITNVIRIFVLAFSPDRSTKSGKPRRVRNFEALIQHGSTLALVPEIGR
jgi:hypothetical protein